MVFVFDLVFIIDKISVSPFDSHTHTTYYIYKMTEPAIRFNGQTQVRALTIKSNSLITTCFAHSIEILLRNIFVTVRTRTGTKDSTEFEMFIWILAYRVYCMYPFNALCNAICDWIVSGIITWKKINPIFFCSLQMLTVNRAVSSF